MKMAWCLWTAALLATASAWTPPTTLLLHPSPIQRTRRHTDTIHHLHLFGWHLELQENRAIRSPYYDECQFYKGHVLNEEDSVVTVTECDGQLYGLLRVGKEDFVLQPNDNKDRKDHVLRRRDVLMEDQPVSYNLTGDTVSELDIDLGEEQPRSHVHVRHSKHEDYDYFRDVMPIVSRPVSGAQGLWLELAIVADHTMLKFHGRERAKHYILALMNIVSAIFSDPSLNSNMTLVINKLYLLEEKDPPVIKHGDVIKSLDNVNTWNYRHLMKLPAGTTGWDAAVWLTRTDLGGPSGFAPVGGVCSYTRSAAIDRDEGLTSAFVIAHELSHILGLTHDGEDRCSSDALRGTVMAPIVMATLYNFAWSKCSREQFHEKSKSWWCLHKRSADEGLVLGGTKELPDAVFTMDEQCRTEFGEGFSVCKSVMVRSACSVLWCSHRSMPDVCKSKRGPPLEGTPCGHNHWCVDQECQPMPGHKQKEVSTNTVDQEEDEIAVWDDWSQWSECSSTCGYGIKYRQRQCRYKGTISETSCEGAASQIATCWAGVCAATRDLRADACARFNKDLVPHISQEESKQCKLSCVSYKGGEVTPYGAVPDGAPCSYERPFDVCFQGACVKGQCNISDTNCNRCPDGYCSNNTYFYIKRLNKGWTRVVVVPHDADQLSVHIATPVPLHVAFRERKRHMLELSKHHSRKFEIEQNTYLRYDPNVPQNLQIVQVDSNVIDIKEDERFGWEGEAAMAGSLLRWKQTDSDVYINAVSKLHTDLLIIATPKNANLMDEIVTVEVSVNYSTPAGRTRPMDYRTTVERGPCSVSCGGGVRAVRPRCHRGQRCPPIKYERCNTHGCMFTWVPGEWEECSATCGKEGFQERQLFCVPHGLSVSSRRDLIKNSVSPVSCSSTKPERVQPCNRIPCPAYWKELPWTPCSTTCGRGVSYRPLMCPAEEDALCGPKPTERRRRCRLRRCPQTPRKPPKCPTSDRSDYCNLFPTEDLIRNCVLPPIKKYCCNACHDVMESIKQRRGG